MEKEISTNSQSTASTSIHWVFILNTVFSKNLKEKNKQIKKINNFFYTPSGWEDNLGSQHQDYQHIMSRISSNCTGEQSLKIYLVMDITSYWTVFKNDCNRQADKYYPFISRIYLFPSFKGQGYQIKRLRQKNPIIDNNYDNFQEFINKDLVEIQEIQSDHPLLSNFNILGLENKQRAFRQRKLKIIACINFEDKYYEQYLVYFLKSLEVKTILNGEIEAQFKEAIKQLRTNNTRGFYMRMFALYKRQPNFYKIINSSIMKFEDKSFNWSTYALPICFMFKAIKMYLKDEKNRPMIESLFDKSGKCTVYRGATFSTSQLKEIQSNLTKSFIFYELVSFTSTSLSKEIALKFINVKNLKNSCLMQFYISKPSFGEQFFESLQFIEFSFAYLGLLWEGDTDEMEIILNSSTVCQIKNIKFVSLKELKKKYPNLKKEFPGPDQDTKIPDIKINILDNLIHQSRLQQFQHEQMENFQLPQSYRHYLSTVNIVKNCKVFDMGHALEHSGNLQQAKKHFQQLLKMEKAKEKKHFQEIWYLLSRLIDILQKMDNIDEALLQANEGIQVCNFIHQSNSNLTSKDHHLHLYKMIEKATLFLQEKYYPHNALDKVTEQINMLLQRSKIEKYGKQASLFQCAEYLNLRGIIYFKEHKIQQARADITKSKQIIQQIFKDINYQSLKTETFYLQFILHYLIDDDAKWDPSQFNKKRRMECIAQATHIFGGEKKLQLVEESSKQLGEEINAYIKKLQKERQGNGVSQLVNRQTIIAKVQKEFSDNELTIGLKKQVEEFFSFFHQIIQENENQTKKAFKNFRQEIQKILIEQKPLSINISDLIEEQKNLRRLKQQIIHTILKDWSSKFQQEDNSLQLSIKYDELIQQKRIMNRKLIEQNYDKITRKNFEEYLKCNIRNIKDVEDNYSSSNYPLPKRFQLKLHYQQAFLYSNLDDDVKQLQILDNIMARTMINFQGKFLDLIPSYFMKLKILFRQAEIQFEQSLLYRGKFERQNIIRAEQKKYIDQCKQIQRDISQKIEYYKRQNNLQLSKLSSDHGIKVMLAEAQIEIEMWQLKLEIFNLIEVKNSSVASKNIKIGLISKRFWNIKEEIDKLQFQTKISQFKADYYETNADFFFIDNQFGLCLDNLLCAFHTTKNNSKKIKLLTKLFMMLGDHRQFNLSQQRKELSHKYKFYEAYPAYWRICLAYHFCYRFVDPSPQPLKVAVRAMSRTPACAFKLKLIHQCEGKFYLAFLQKGSLIKDNSDSNENPQSAPTSEHDIYCKNLQFYNKNRQCILPNNQLENKVFNDIKTRIKLHENFRIVKRAKTMTQSQKKRYAAKKTAYQQYLDQIMKKEFTT